MSFSFAPPAAAGAATMAGQGAPAGQASAGAGDPLGLFGQLLAMLGIDPEAADQLDPKTLAQTLGKAGAKTGAGSSQDDDKSKDGAKTDTTGPVDLSALIAALLAAAQQTVPATTATSEVSTADQGVGGVAADGGRASPIQAQLETLLAALTGQAEPDAAAKAAPALQTAATLTPEPALAAPRIAALAVAQASAPPVPAEAIEAPLPVAEAITPPARLPVAAEAVAVQVQAAAPASKPAAPLAARPTSAVKPAAASSSIQGQDDAKAGPIQEGPEPLRAEPPLDAMKASPPGKTGSDLAALAGDLAAKAAEKPSEDDTQPTLAGLTAPTASRDAAAAAAAAATEVRGSPETVAKLAAQIIKKLDTKVTRFEVGLDPIGLGRVEVRVEIGAGGKLHAQMSFENPAAAADLRGRASQLRDALEQAGFDLKGGSLSFDVAGQGGQGRGQQQQQQGDQPRFAGAAGVFEAALNLGDTPITAPVWAKSGAASGVDIRI